MNCPRCGRTMSNVAEGQEFATRLTARPVPYRDDYGNLCQTYPQYVRAIHVVYECDNAGGCEARYQWDSRSRRLRRTG